MMKETCDSLSSPKGKILGTFPFRAICTVLYRKVKLFCIIFYTKAKRMLHPCVMRMARSCVDGREGCSVTVNCPEVLPHMVKTKRSFTNKNNVLCA